ncbi:4-hydroxy-tetrahydrodipicolinate reductase [Candidatus Altiarchaeota archaeon]
MTIKIALIGLGRMGKKIAARISDEHDMKVVAAFAAPGSPEIGGDIGIVSGVGDFGVEVNSVDKLDDILKEKAPDVVIDFTIAKACVINMETVANNGINMVVGTTGLSDEDRSKMAGLIEGNGVGAVISPNMSVAVNVYLNIIRKAAKMLADYDVEIVEAHHKFKKDAPSGTALKIAQVIAEATGRDLADAGVYGRKGVCPRNEGDIGIHSIRAGDIVGDHTVYFGTIGDHLEFTHRAHSRDAFVNGVMMAVRFIHDKKGLYGMDDVLDLK